MAAARGNPEDQLNGSSESRDRNERLVRESRDHNELSVKESRGQNKSPAEEPRDGYEPRQKKSRDRNETPVKGSRDHSENPVKDTRGRNELPVEELHGASELVDNDPRDGYELRQKKSRARKEVPLTESRDRNDVAVKEFREEDEEEVPVKNGEVTSNDSESRGPGPSKRISTAQQPVDRFGFYYGGSQYTDPESWSSPLPVEVVRERELKWLDMLENWEMWMSKRFKKVKERCRKGIPASLRSRAWQYLCGSKFLLEHNRSRFEEYVQRGETPCTDEIRRDLHRQFPYHEMFRKGGHGQDELFKVLKAYSIYNPRDGYCQAQAPIAAFLLMHMPAEQAFWCLVSICDKYLPGYYSPGLEQVQIDGDVLFGLLKKSSHSTYKHLKKHRVEPILYMTEWFMCVFIRTLPWSTLLRVWDMFLCEGVKILFRVALTIFKLALSTPSQLEQSAGLFEIMELLKHLPQDILNEEFLVREMLKLGVTERDMEKEHQYQLAKRRQGKEEKGKKEKSKS